MKENLTYIICRSTQGHLVFCFSFHDDHNRMGWIYRHGNKYHYTSANTHHLICTHTQPHTTCNPVLWWCDTIFRTVIKISARFFFFDLSILHISSTYIIHTILRDSALLYNDFINARRSVSLMLHKCGISNKIYRRDLPPESISAVTFPRPGI